MKKFLLALFVSTIIIPMAFACPPGTHRVHPGPHGCVANHHPHHPPVIVVPAPVNHFDDVYLGEVNLRDADEADDRRTLIPNRSYGFDALRIDVKGNAADVEVLKVWFCHGGYQEITNFKDDLSGSSRFKDLQGTDRCIERIVVVGDSNGWFKPKSKVKVWGRRVF